MNIYAIVGIIFGVLFVIILSIVAYQRYTQAQENNSYITELQLKQIRLEKQLQKEKEKKTPPSRIVYPPPDYKYPDLKPTDPSGPGKELSSAEQWIKKVQEIVLFAKTAKEAVDSLVAIGAASGITRKDAEEWVSWAYSLFGSTPSPPSGGGKNDNIKNNPDENINVKNKFSQEQFTMEDRQSCSLCGSSAMRTATNAVAGLLYDTPQEPIRQDERHTCRQCLRSGYGALSTMYIKAGLSDEHPPPPTPDRPLPRPEPIVYPVPIQPQVFTEDDFGKTVTIDGGGRPFALRFSSNPSTGFQWSIVSAPGMRQLADWQYTQDPDCGGRVGCGGTSEVQLIVTQKNLERGQVRVKYARPWSSEYAHEGTITFRVQQKQPPQEGPPNIAFSSDPTTQEDYESLGRCQTGRCGVKKWDGRVPTSFKGVL
jgi:predicted secreted protein